MRPNHPGDDVGNGSVVAVGSNAQRFFDARFDVEDQGGCLSSGQGNLVNHKSESLYKSMTYGDSHVSPRLS